MCSIAFAGLLSAQHQRIEISKVYLDRSGAVHVVDQAGKDHPVPKESFSSDQHQVDAVQIQIAPDKRAVGWVVEFSGIGTNYPVGIILQIWRNGKVVNAFAEEGGLMFETWRFFDGSAKVGFHEVPIHGDPDQEFLYEMHEVGTGKLLAKWTLNGENKTAPDWVKALQSGL
jgi:hypothetical protein